MLGFALREPICRICDDLLAETAPVGSILNTNTCIRIGNASGTVGTRSKAAASNSFPSSLPVEVTYRCITS